MLGLIYKDFIIMKKEILLNMVAIVGFSIPVILPWNKIMEEANANTELINGYTMSYIIMPFVMYFFMYNIIGGLQSNLFVHDENKCYSSWVVSTPETVKGHIRSKYFGALIFLFGGIVWSMICDIVASFVNGTVRSTLSIAIVFFFLQMFISAFELPFAVRFGYKNGTTFKVAMIAVVFFGVIVYGLFGPLPNIDADSVIWYVIEWLVRGSNMSTVMLGCVSFAPFLIVCLYYISYKVSVRLYPKGVENYEH